MLIDTMHAIASMLQSPVIIVLIALVAVVVVTPELTRNGDTPGALPAETQLLIQCSEKPQVARAQPGVITALDAAEIVMYALDGSQFCWLSTRQTIDRQAGVLTATVTFATTIHLS